MLRSQALGDAVVGGLFGIAFLLTPMALVSWRSINSDISTLGLDWTMVGTAVVIWTVALAGLVSRLGLLHKRS